MFKTVLQNDQKWLIYKNWEIISIVWKWTYFFTDMEIYNIYTDFWCIENEKIEILYNTDKDLVLENFSVFELSDYEFWILYKWWRVVDFLNPGKTYFFFKWKFEIEVEKINFKNSPQIPSESINEFNILIEKYGKIHYIQNNIISANQKWLLIINGKINSIIEPWRYMFFTRNDIVQVLTFESIKNKLEISWQELLTKDKYNLRINVTIFYSITDVIQYYQNYWQWVDFIYSEWQFAIREIISKYTLDDILEKKDIIWIELKQYISNKILESCVIIENIWVKDIILPWEMREIMNQVIQAEKTLQVNAIKRRDEVANVRNLLNTAKLYEENPMLLRLKEIDTLEKVVEKIKNLHVNNGFDWLLDLVKIRK